MLIMKEGRCNPRLTLFVILFAVVCFQNSAWAGATADEIRQWLEIHNQFRALHQVAPVVWSDAVAASAQAFVNTCPTNHSNSGYGENLAWGYPSIAAVVTAWYEEEALYDYANPGFSYDTGHFTQVVWKGTTEIGCAFKTGCSGWPITWVCQYNPPGNYLGQFEENVFPKKETAVPSAPSGVTVE